MNKVRLTREWLARRAENRPEGYLADMMRAAVAEDATTVTFDAGGEAWAEFSVKYGGGKPRPRPEASGVRHVARGAVGLTKAACRIQRAPPKVIAARKATCKECEHATKVATVVRSCGLCNCALFAKVLIATEACPAGKWPAHSAGDVAG